jgi:hypothetical protein
MTTAELAAQFNDLCRQSKFVEAVDKFYSDDIVSLEAMDYQGGREMRGKETVRRKNTSWLEENEVHSVSVKGPFASPEKFALVFSFDFTRKDTNERQQLNEVAVYTVVGGKIVREEFLYAA